MDSVMKGQLGAMPSPRIFGLEPPLDPYTYTISSKMLGMDSSFSSVAQKMARFVRLNVTKY